MSLIHNSLFLATNIICEYWLTRSKCWHTFISAKHKITHLLPG